MNNLTDDDVKLISSIPYPHITRKIVLMWGSSELGTYLNSLLLADRDIPRLGFPPEVSKSIFSLITRNEVVQRALGGKPDMDTISGNDWVNETGKWKILKRQETPPKR